MFINNKTVLNFENGFIVKQKQHRIYISANSVGLNDGINFVDDCVDVEQTKETFRMIFTLMEQKQHYDMMMENH